jgi:hypothetical protein
MAGVIGLTTAGQHLDMYLTKYKPSYTAKLYKFITKFSIRVNKYHTILSNCGTYDDKAYIFSIIRKEYTERLNIEFKNEMDKYPYSLARNYINTLTKAGFVPSTKTQEALLRKNIQRKESV